MILLGAVRTRQIAAAPSDLAERSRSCRHRLGSGRAVRAAVWADCGWARPALRPRRAYGDVACAISSMWRRGRLHHHLPWVFCCARRLGPRSIASSERCVLLVGLTVVAPVSPSGRGERTATFPARLAVGRGGGALSDICPGDWVHRVCDLPAVRRAPKREESARALGPGKALARDTFRRFSPAPAPFRRRPSCSSRGACALPPLRLPFICTRATLEWSR